jgi:hypothetical protein
MICPKCLSEHNKPGKFCSRKCANGRIFTDSSKIKKSVSNKLYYETVDNETMQARTVKSVLAQKENHIDKVINGNFDLLSKEAKRKRILHEQDDACNICKIPQKWNDKFLSFQLDHGSGDRRNESRKNLQMICPNCHSHTDTYCGRNGTKVTNKEIANALSKTINNHQLCILLGLNPSMHTYKRINKIRALLV